jgi:hypothetical protein
LLQQYLHTNKQFITSLYTTQNKLVVIAVDSNEKYIVYRYGTSKKVERNTLP